jgi:hypothetical protein
MQDDQDYKKGIDFKKDDKVDVISKDGPYIQESFDLKRMEDFVTGLGVEFLHYKSLPSPIGKKDRGDYRRSDGVDTITSNGMIYKCAGRFTATMTDNSRDRKRSGAGTMDPSEGLLVMPRFYNKVEPNGHVIIAGGDRIYLAPGDRIYVADPKVDVLVSNPQEIDYEENIDNIPMFPIVRMELPIIDSRNIEYMENVDFCITKEGNIHWMPGGKSPGIDPDTSKGRIYSIRYLYRAYWYVTQLLKEVRITNVTIDNERVPERASYHLLVQREYIYHNQNRGSETNQLKPKDKKRTAQEPIESTSQNRYQVPVQPPDERVAKYTVPVDMSSIGDDEE